MPLISTNGVMDSKKGHLAADIVFIYAGSDQTLQSEPRIIVIDIRDLPREKPRRPEANRTDSPQALKSEPERVNDDYLNCQID